MKLRTKFAKSVCMTILYIAVVSAVYVGLYKLTGEDITSDSYFIMLASSAILLHFMEKEEQEERNRNDL